MMDMRRLKMGALPQGQSDSAAMREDTQGYGQELSWNMLDWEVYGLGGL